MEKRNNKDTEDFLGLFSLKTAPPGLKEKILDGALQKQKSDQGMTIFLRKGFVGCLLTLSIVIAVDATISGAQNRRFASFLDKQQDLVDKTEDEWSMLKDIIWDTFDPSDNAVKKKFYGSKEKSINKGRLFEWRESLEKEFE